MHTHQCKRHTQSHIHSVKTKQKKIMSIFIISYLDLTMLKRFVSWDDYTVSLHPFAHTFTYQNNMHEYMNLTQKPY